MTDPRLESPPQPSPPGGGTPREPTARQDDGGCLVALLIVTGITLVLLGAFVGLCAVAIGAAPLLLLIGIVAVGLGIWFFTLARKLHRRPMSTTGETGNGGRKP